MPTDIVSLVAYFQVHFRLNFILEANTMDPDPTATLKQSNLDPYGLQLIKICL